MYPFSTPWKQQKTVKFSVSRDALGTNGITIKTAVILDNIKQILIDTFETLPIYWVKAHSPNIYLFKVNNKNSIK